MMYPPRVGPSVGPTTTPNPNNAVAIPICAGGQASMRIAWKYPAKRRHPRFLQKAKDDQFPDIIRISAEGGGDSKEDDREK